MGIQSRFISFALVLFIFLLSDSASSQDFSRMDIDFIQDGSKLKNALAGGLRSGQYSSIDLDNDGKKDLFVFDRGSGQILTFINKGGPGEINYKFDPTYEDIFPEMESWTLLRDFNEDGIEDIFTGFAGGIHVYRGQRINGELSFKFMPFAESAAGLNQISFPAGANYSQVPAAGTDIPSITDVDGDGDLDILSFEPGGSYVYYFKNESKERFLDDTLVYSFDDLCWGKFFESGISEDVSLTDDCEKCATLGDGGKVRHAGSTLTSFDGDGDGDHDLLVGDLSNNHMLYLTNGGNQLKACMEQQDINFPSYDVPIDLFIFNAAFFLDINNDGKRDLIATTNNTIARNVDHVWLYINEGEDNAPNFRLERKNFLINSMFSVGGNSSPVFTDFNQDGLLDLVVGSSGKTITGSDREGNLELWLNTGSKEQAEYTLEEDDLLGFKSLSNNGTNFDPVFGDIDDDGDEDLFVGDVNGQLYFFRNTAGKDMPYTFDSRRYPFADIFIGQSASPALVDFNEDGINDLVIGEGRGNLINGFRGSLNYFKNFGSTDMENFTDAPTTQILYQFISGQPEQSFYSSTPVYVEHPEGGYYLFVGSDKGEIYVLTDVLNNINGPVNVLSSKLGDLDLGRRSSVAVADIDDDEYLEIIVGTSRGGLEAFNTELKAKKSISTNEVLNYPISIYPNPSLDWIYFEGFEEVAQRLEIKDLSGKTVLVSKLDGNKANIQELESGLYLATLFFETGQQSIKLVKM